MLCYLFIVLSDCEHTVGELSQKYCVVLPTCLSVFLHSVHFIMYRLD